MPADAISVLARIVELTELESAHIDAIDADALHRVCDERARLLALLPATLPVEAQPLLDRFHAVRTANEAAAERTAAELRSQLSHIGAGRNALTAYAPMGPSISVDRSG